MKSMRVGVGIFTFGCIGANVRGCGWSLAFSAAPELGSWSRCTILVGDVGDTICIVVAAA